MSTGSKSQNSESGIQNPEATTAVLYITDNGLMLAKRLKGFYPEARLEKFSAGVVPQLWKGYKNLIFIMAAGIVVRTIAPLVRDKKTDPAVVVLDEKGRFAISLLSGHVGGANKLAHEIAGFLGMEAVITTSSDLNNATSIDLWAADNQLVIDNWKLLPTVSARLLNTGMLNVYSDADIRLPDDFSVSEDAASADILITNKVMPDNKNRSRLIVRPKNIIAGIGCNSGTSADEIEAVVSKIFAENKFSFSAIHSLATIDKKGKELGLVAFAQKYNINVRPFTPEELNSVKGIARSEAAFRATGANAVAEPAALLAAGTNRLLVTKQKCGNVTLALAEIKRDGEERMKGRIYIVGTGPGGIEHITPLAQEAIKKSEAIVGYSTYLSLIEGLSKGKEIFSTGMTKEVDRCKKAVELAGDGKVVSLISGGDPGVYAMAGLVFEILKSNQEAISSQHSAVNRTRQEPKTIQVEVIPGISALNACAARLGAPLMHDFASISLSDRLTSWELIEKRLEAAAMADFVIVIYNPKSKGRVEHISRARDIILKYRNDKTPVGIVKGAMREGETVVITDLGHMLDNEIDMQTTVIVGNSTTFKWDNRMITPRGYEKKFTI